jgi:hypothetical protein
LNAAVISQEWDPPFYRVHTESLDVTFIIGADEDFETADAVDVEVRLADGSRWSATVFTLAAIESVMSKNARTGESLGGSYFWCSDLLIVREPGVYHIIDVLVGVQRGDDDPYDLRDILSPLGE